MNIFLDTNILLDLVRANPLKRDAAKELLEVVTGRGNKGIIAATSIKDACWIIENGTAFKDAYPDPLDRKRLSGSLRSFILNALTIAPVDEIVIRRANGDSNEADFEDAVIAACAELSEAECIVSNDRRAFRHTSLRKYSPIGCLEALTP